MRIPAPLQHRPTFRASPCIFAGLIALVLFCAPLPALSLDLRLGYLENDAFARFAGRTVCRLIQRHAQGLDCQAVSGPDEVQNLTNLAGGFLDLAIVDALSLQDALDRTGRFAYLAIRYDNLRRLARLCDLPVTLVVRRDAKIGNLDALKGGRLNAGAPGSATRAAMEIILRAKGWKEADFSLFQELPTSLGQASMAFCQGTVQAMLHVGVHPDDGLRQVFNLCPADLLGMDDPQIEALVKAHPALVRIEIPARVYSSQRSPVTTFGTRLLLVTAQELDAETAGRILDVLTTRRSFLKTAHPALNIEVDRSAPGGLELHPGAVRFLSTHQ
jgi:TRAP transporter TAXI family solute receptor